MDYLALIVLLGLWCAIHSAMISLAVTNYLKNNLSGYYKFYRLFYNLFALFTFIPLVLYSHSFDEQCLFRWEGYLTIIRVVLLLVVFVLFIAGFLKYDMLQFAGIRQIKSGNIHSTLTEAGSIDTSGILGITRHPWYLAVLIFLWVVHGEIYISTLIVNTILSAYLIIGTILEERKLIIELGDTYREYMNRVSMLFPVKWILEVVKNKKN